MIDLGRELGLTDERVPMASAGRLARAEARIRVSEHCARYHWASQLVAGRDVLDAGCGAGQGSGILAEAGARHVIGVDSSPGLIGEAEGSIGGSTDFVLADLAALPFTDGSFEVVVCFDAVGPSPEAAAVIRELRRVLRPDGRLLISLARSAAADRSADGDGRDSTRGGPDEGELAPGGLEALLVDHFAGVGLYAQQGCLGSVVRPIDRSGEPPSDGRMQTLTRRLARDDPAETRILAVASVTGPVSPLEPTAVVGSLAGVRGSPGRLDEAPRSGGPGASSLGGSDVDARLAALTRRLVEAETENARIPELQRYLQACECEVRKFESSLLGRIGKAIYYIRLAFR